MPRNGVQNLLCNRPNLHERLFCVYIVIFGEDEGKSYHILRIEAKTGEGDIGSAKSNEFPRLLVRVFFRRCTACFYDCLSCILSLHTELCPQKISVACLIITPEKCLQILPQRIARIVNIVEIVQFFLFLDTNEHRNTTRPLMHSRTQGCPCCSGRIRHARCAAMKE